MSTRALAPSCLVVLALGASGSIACGLVEQDGGSPAAGSGGSGSGGSGTGGTFGYPPCERLPGQNERATSGTRLISGRVRTPAGVAIPNLRVTLGDAVYYTSLYGSYEFLVEPGTYEVALGDDTCVVDPPLATALVDKSDIELNAEYQSGVCTMAPMLEAWWGGGNIGFDDPSLQNTEAASDWITSAYFGIEWGEESVHSQLAYAEEDSICTFQVGHVVGFESRRLMTSESGGDYLSLDTLFLNGDDLFTFRTPVAIDASEEEIARRLVPVRNLTRRDLFPPPQTQ